MQRANCKFVEVTENNLYNNNVTLPRSGLVRCKSCIQAYLFFLFHAKNNHVQHLNWINKAINNQGPRHHSVSNCQHVLFTRREKSKGQNSSTGYVRSKPWPSAKKHQYVSLEVENNSLIRSLEFVLADVLAGLLKQHNI